MLNSKIAILSGGSGGFTVCRALRRYPWDITAIPSVFDNGGSTGVLKDAYGELPKGDVRRCIVGLLPPEHSMDWRRLFEHRFEGGPFDGHTLGNALLSAAEQQSDWGREGGIQKICEMLGTEGRVVPVSLDDANLCAELSDGEVIVGETAIDQRPLCDDRSIKRIFLSNPVTVYRGAVESVLNADVIVLSPGDLYTSLLPNFLVNGIVDALNVSKAKLVYVVNLMTKPSETRGYDAVCFVSKLYEYGLTRKINYLMVNNQSIPDELLLKYQQQDGAELVAPPSGNYNQVNLFDRLIATPLLSQRGLSEGLIRHSASKLGQTINNILSDHI